MTCRHGIERWREKWDSVIPGKMVSAWCDGCRDQVPLGPANDTPEALVEVRAAELSHLATSHADHMESAGWSAVRYDAGPLDDSRWHAGWLGRVIFDERRAESMP